MVTTEVKNVVNAQKNRKESEHSTIKKGHQNSKRKKGTIKQTENKEPNSSTKFLPINSYFEDK